MFAQIDTQTTDNTTTLNEFSGNSGIWTFEPFKIEPLIKGFILKVFYVFPHCDRLFFHLAFFIYFFFANFLFEFCFCRFKTSQTWENGKWCLSQVLRLDLEKLLFICFFTSCVWCVCQSMSGKKTNMNISNVLCAISSHNKKTYFGNWVQQ